MCVYFCTISVHLFFLVSLPCLSGDVHVRILVQQVLDQSLVVQKHRAIAMIWLTYLLTFPLYIIMYKASSTSSASFTLNSYNSTYFHFQKHGSVHQVLIRNFSLMVFMIQKEKTVQGIVTIECFYMLKIHSGTNDVSTLKFLVLNAFGLNWQLTLNVFCLERSIDP